ncbi:MAG: glycosyltransferase family 39 protein [Acidimicrobiales bacterium]
MHLGYRGGRQADDDSLVEERAGGEAAAASPARVDARRRVSGWQVAAAVVVATGITVRFTARSHLWLDEALSVNIARLPLGRIPAALRHDGAPPLYYVLLHAWMSVFGTGTIAVRALSGVFSVASFPLVWIAGRRVGGRRVAAAATLLFAASPFAVRYGTETRMYSLLTLLALGGWLAMGDLLRRFSWSRALAVAGVTAALLYTHYWSIYLLAVAAGVVVRRAFKGPRRDEARRALGAMAAGGALFLPWAPSFLFQLRHTGTPWAGAATPRVLFDTVFQFAGGFWDPGFVLGLLSWLLIVFALFGRPVDGRRIELDLRTRPEGRLLFLAGFGTLAVAVVAGAVTRSAFAVRYASVLFPFLLLLVALGTEALADVRVFRATVAVAVVLGFIAIVPNVVGDRTTAPKVAAILRAQGRPGDVVAYCPDQLGPAVSRLLGPKTGLVQLTFPGAGTPDRVDWVDYQARNHAATTAPFTSMLLERAGPDHTIWLVWSPDYRTFGTKCTALGDRLQAARPDIDRVLKIQTRYSEHPGLIRYRPGRQPPAGT